MVKFRKRKTIFDLINEKQLESPNTNSKKVHAQISVNEENLKNLFKNSADFVTRIITVEGEKKILLAYIDGLIDTKSMDETLLKPLFFKGLPNGLSQIDTLGQVLQNELFSIAQVSAVSKMDELVDGLLKANVGIMVEGETDAILADLKGFEKRSISEPQTEVSIRGPRDGFTEVLRTNTMLIRRRIRSTKLKFEAFSIGEYSKTDIEMAYIDDIAPEPILEEVRQRLKRIKMDGVLESEFIEEFIEDSPFSPFPQVQNTERPDIAAANLLEGKVLILVDNTPFALIIPMTFWSGLQSVEDYYERFIYTTFIRIVRFIFLMIALFLPSLYVALTTFHPELIPTTLLISVAAAREGVPFPSIIEAIIMELVFEGLREAGIRLPKPVGSAVSIVGALVIGQAAVQAGIVSAPMVIVVATTGIASFAIPRYNFGTAFRMLRFFLLMLAAIFGLYGIAFGFIAITIHLVTLRSFGVPYFSPVAPLVPNGLKDVIVRVPKWNYNLRPPLTATKNMKRIPYGQKPKPGQGGNDQ